MRALGIIRSNFKFNTVLVLVLTFILSACTRDTQDKNPNQVQVRLPWYASVSGYQLAVINLSTIENMVFLVGKAARFLISPQEQNGKLVGTSPIIHTMRTSDGIYIPEDYLSAEMLTLYAHFEKLQDFDRESGIDKMIKNWPRQQTIAVAAQIISQDGSVMHDNAMYDGKFDAFLFPTYDLSNLPISLNQAIVGHEYFHAIFYQLYSKNLEKPEVGTADRDSYHSFLMRGLNEGLADVWGWLYSGDYQFLSRSVPGYDRRNLDNTQRLIKLDIDNIKAQAHNYDTTGAGDFYYVGTTYAQKLFSATQAAISKGDLTPAVARIKLAKAISKSLVRLSQEYQSLKKDEFVLPTRPLQLIQDEIPEIKIEMQ